MQQPVTQQEPRSAYSDEDGTLHEQYTISVFIGPEYYGSFPLDPGAQPGLGYRRHGVAYFCPDCGEVWARLVFMDSRRIVNPFLPVRAACPKHPDQWEVPGSLLAGGLDALLYALPERLLMRELALHLG